LHKKLLTLGIALFLISFQTLAFAITVPNMDQFIVAVIGEPESVDPAKSYDTASANLIMNVYDTLIKFEREDLLTYVGHVSDTWTIVDSTTYRFHIRSGVKWHDGSGDVTPRDVEYSIERGMVVDYVGGPNWMLYEPLLGGWNAKGFDTYNDTAGAPGSDGMLNSTEASIGGHLIDDAVVVVDGAGTPDVNGEYVQFNLAIPYAPFMQILAQAWASIQDEGWSTAQGAWPGFDVTNGYLRWTDYCQRINGSVLVSFDAGGGTPGNHVMMGSGPYKFFIWEVGNYWEITKFDDYVLGWPAKGAAKSVSTVTKKYVANWPTRKVLFLSNNPNQQADMVNVPRANIGEIAGEPGVRGVKDIPSLVLSPAMHFNYDIASTSTYFATKPTLDGSAKLDMLSDVHLRKALAHSLDYATYIVDAYLGEADQPATPAIKGLTYSWSDLGKTPVAYDLAAAETEFQAAWGGDLWSKSWTLPVTYNEGNVQRETAALMLEYAIENLIPWPGGITVDIQTFGLPWGSTYIPALIAGELPNFFIGWLADYADPHNFIFPYMHTQGDFAGFQAIQYGQSAHTQKGTITDPFGTDTVDLVADIGAVNGILLNNTYVDSLIFLGIAKTVEGERRAIYNELQDIFLAEFPTIPVAQPTTRHWERDWVQGWYFNPLTPNGATDGYFYHFWKGATSDITGDDDTSILDAGKMSTHFDIVGPSGYDRVADIYPVTELGGVDYKIRGTDGHIDIFDAAQLNTDWGETAVGA